MFANIDYDKRMRKAKFELAKPNKRIISPISELFNAELSVKYGNINELKFSIPYLVDDGNDKLVRNKHVDTIKEKMLIRVTMSGYKEWFIVEDISEDGEDKDTFNVVAYSLGYELRGKRVSGLVIEAENAIGVLSQILTGTTWMIDEVDAMFNSMYRSFDSGDDGNALDCVLQWAETYGGILIWDSVHRKISLKNPYEHGRFRGLSASHDRLLKSVSKKRTASEMATRLYVEGSEGLDIRTVNPTGQPYLEDFSYFMHPFEVDKNGNVIKSSDYMSDELCLALIEHQRVVQGNAPIIRENLTELRKVLGLLTTAETTLNTLELELDNIQQLLDLALSTENHRLIEERRQERSAKLLEVENQRVVVLSLEGRRNAIEYTLSNLQGQIENGEVFTPELLTELDPYIIEAKWSDDRYIDELELYEDAIKKFEELRKPKIVVDISIDNLMNIIEEQHSWDKLILGDLIKIKYDQMNLEYTAKIIEMNFLFEEEEINLVVANTTELLSETDKLTQILYDSQSATALIQNNKYKWDKINAVSEQVISLLSNEWDATKNKIIAGINNSVEVGKRGIIIKNPDYPNEVVIMQSGVIALSKDGGETWKTAIKPDGIVAERLVGQIIAGQQLLITNNAGTFTLDDNGAIFNVNSFRIISSTSEGGNPINLVDRWQSISTFAEGLIDDNIVTPYEKELLQVKWSEIENQHTSFMELIDRYYDNDNYPSPVVTYLNGYNALKTYLFTTLHGEYPILSPHSMGFSTQVVSATFKKKFNDYNSSLAELNKTLMLTSKDLADRAKEMAEEAKENIEEVMNDVVYKIELHSSNGLAFKNNVINTTITAKVYRGQDDITSTLEDSNFIWKKFNKDGVEDIQWGKDNANIGNTIIVTGADVVAKATFKCDVSI